MRTKRSDAAARDVARVLDRKATADDYELTQFAENYKLFTEKNENKVPLIVEPTILAGSWAKQIARSGTCVVIQPLDVETHRWLKEGSEGDDVKDTLYLADVGILFYAKIILMRDVLRQLRNDDELVDFIEHIVGTKEALPSDFRLLFDIKMPRIGTVTHEIGGVNVIETYTKLKPRTLHHSLIIRDGEQGFMLDEEVTTWTVSDIYAACKKAGFKPGAFFNGQDTTRFVSYMRS